MSSFSGMATALNGSILSAFGEPVVIRQNTDEYAVSAVFTSPGVMQVEWPSGFNVAQFRRSDAPGVQAGATLISDSAVYRIVEIDQKLENWTVVKLQKVRDRDVE